MHTPEHTDVPSTTSCTSSATAEASQRHADSDQHGSGEETAENVAAPSDSHAVNSTHVNTSIDGDPADTSDLGSDFVHVDRSTLSPDDHTPSVKSPSVKSPDVKSPDVSSAQHHVRWVQFHSARAPVVTQNVNGPCPLLALVNVMLLKGKLQLPDALPLITIGQLMELVGDQLLSAAASSTTTDGDAASACLSLDHEYNVHDALATLPKLQTGLDVNIKFSGVSEFEYTPECVIFDLLRVRLYHGWVVDPGDGQLQQAVGGRGYNQLVEAVINDKQSADQARLARALLAEEFLESTASQLTEYGLRQLTDVMCDGELSVLFRNNHFCTVYKFEGTVYVLVSDQGFLCEPSIVWETLTSASGAGHFVGGDFQASSHHVSSDTSCSRRDHVSSSPTAIHTDQQVNHDYLLALSLQQQEVATDEESPMDDALTQQQQQQQQHSAATDAAATSQTERLLSDAELARKLQDKEDYLAAVGGATSHATNDATNRPSSTSSTPSHNTSWRRSTSSSMRKKRCIVC